MISAGPMPPQPFADGPQKGLSLLHDKRGRVKKPQNLSIPFWAFEQEWGHSHNNKTDLL